MPDTGQGIKHFFLGVLQSAVWDGFKQAVGGSLLTSLVLGLYEYFRHQSVDCWGLLVLGVVSASFIWFIRKTTNTSESGAGPDISLIQIQPPPNIQGPAWAGYESEQAWRDGIAQQNRLIELGRSIDGLFTQLQIETFHLAKGMRDLAVEMGPRPSVNPDEFQGRGDSRIEDHIKAQFKLADPWFAGVRSRYHQRQFAQRLKTVRLQLGEAGLTDASELEEWIDVDTQDERKLLACSRKLDQLAVSLSDVQLQEYNSAQLAAMPIDTVKWKIEKEPGFKALVNYYQSHNT